jgi:hypothetical protein
MLFSPARRVFSSGCGVANPARIRHNNSPLYSVQHGVACSGLPDVTKPFLVLGIETSCGVCKFECILESLLLWSCLSVTSHYNHFFCFYASADDTAAAVVRSDGKILSNVVASQVRLGGSACVIKYLHSTPHSLSFLFFMSFSLSYVCSTSCTETSAA